MAGILQACLVLADGTVFHGIGFGAPVLRTGEVVFNTSMTGYQEILTDPSYQGQIVVLTYPHIGNYGVNPVDVESRSVFASGLVVRDLSPVVSNYRSRQSLGDYLKKSKVPGIFDIDTRALVRHIRNRGAMQAVLAVGNKVSLVKLKKIAAQLPGMVGQNLAQVVSCSKSYVFNKGLPDVVKSKKKEIKKISKKSRVAAYDFGIKENILRLLVESGCDVTVFPYAYPAEKILNAPKKFDGVFLSNGPGDPEPCTIAIDNVKKLLGKKPIFGICLGHQILALALGAKTYKLKFGHHGGNQPVMAVASRKVEITAQNHGFAVDADTLPRDVEVTHVHMNDNTVSGLTHKKWPAFSVQYHPEASPGPHDSQYLFKRFIKMMAV
jgi:carbamoyl-phosphate synthase small subunit